MLKNILQKVKATEVPDHVPGQGVQMVHESQQLLRKQQTKAKPLQNPLPIPTTRRQLEDTPKQETPTDKPDIKLRQFTPRESAFKPVADTQPTSALEPKIRPFTYHEPEPKRDTEFTSETKKAKPKLNYEALAKEIRNECDKENAFELDYTSSYDDAVSQWIYEQILECDSEELPLPLPQDIVIKFPLISIEKAKYIRDELIDEVIVMSKGQRPTQIGSRFSTFNPLETKSNRDPFDFNAHAHAHAHEHKQMNDAEFNDNAINLNGLNPATWYGYNNKVWSSYTDCHEPCVEEVESEYGKFRGLITRDKTLSIEMILDLRRKIHGINCDRRTIAFGVTSGDRKELFGDMDTARMLHAHAAGIRDIGCLYLSNLFGLTDDVMHLQKPLIMATSGVLNGIQNSLYLCGGMRLSDSSMRMVFNRALYGQIACGGFHYFVSQIRSKEKQHQMILKSILSNEGITCWNLHEMGLVDWVMPSPNNVLFFTHFGNQIDKTFNFNFKSQDRFRHGAMLKSVIELFDRGTERYSSDADDDNACFEYIFGAEYNVDLKQIVKRIHDIANGECEFAQDVDEYTIANIIYKANKLKDNLSKVSPLALYLSYLMSYAAVKEFNRIQSQAQSQPQAQTDFFRNLLSYEYHAMCWLMHFGEFWEGLKLKEDSNYTPKWRWSSLEQMLSSKDITHLIPINSDTQQNIFLRCRIFNELPYSWMKPLQFEEREEPNSVTAKEFKNSKESNQYYLSDYLHLGGAIRPDIQSKLIKEYNQY